MIPIKPTLIKREEINKSMAGKMIKLMKASAEKLESVEGIDSGMAATIIERRETQQYIDPS
jgi:DNA uptake protein ComE-like DNA-binding protein